MKFNSKSESDDAIVRFINWIGIIYNGNKITRVFTGTLDPELTRMILAGEKGTHSSITFNERDDRDATLWVAFQNDEIVHVSEIMRDAYMNEITTISMLRYEILVADGWTEPIRIPKGLHIRIIFKTGGNFDMVISDKGNADFEYKRSYSKDEGDIVNIHYGDLQIPIDKLIEGEISFKLKDNDVIAQVLVVRFSEILDRYIL